MAVAVGEDVRAVVEPIVAGHGLTLYDVEHAGGVVRVLVERAGAGVDLDTLASLSRAVSQELDRSDPVPGRYTLEVSSPGLERRLRRPEHFEGAVGSEVTVKLAPDPDGRADDEPPERRVTGPLTAAGESGIVVAGRTIAYERIETARTTFDWGPKPPPGKGSRSKKRSKR